jgi:hypothetical protein
MAGCWVGAVCILLFAAGLVSAESKKFGDFFSPAGKVTLQDPKLKFADLSEMDVSRSGKIVAIYANYEEPHGLLKIFTPQGRLERTVNPLEHQPYKRYADYVDFAKGYLNDVAVADDGEIVVAATFQILFYDSLGHFLRLSNLGAVELENGKIVFKRLDFPFRLGVGFNGQIAGALRTTPDGFNLRTYDRKGKLQKGFFSMDPENRGMSSAYPSGLDVDSLGDIWCTLERVNKVFHYGMDGSPKNEIVGKSPLYKDPLQWKEPEELKERRRWNETWTKVVNCAVTQSGYVILMMTAGGQGKSLVPTYRPDEPPYEPYPGGLLLDIYDREGNTIVTGLHTPHRFLTVDKQDNLWFDLRSQTPENPSKDGPVVLGKYKLNLKPASRGESLSKAGRQSQ